MQNKQQNSKTKHSKQTETTTNKKKRKKVNKKYIAKTKQTN